MRSQCKKVAYVESLVIGQKHTAGCKKISEMGIRTLWRLRPCFLELLQKCCVVRAFSRMGSTQSVCLVSAFHILVFLLFSACAVSFRSPEYGTNLLRLKIGEQ